MNDPLIQIGKTAKLIGVSIDTLRRWDRQGILKSFRPSATSNRYYREADIKAFLEKQSPVDENEIKGLARRWVTVEADFPLPETWYCKTSDIFNGRLDTLGKELEKQPGLKKVYPLVVAVTGEIGNNSYNHNLGNWHDAPGSFFGYHLGRGEVVLADRGQGILATLQRVLPELKDDRAALETAFTKYVSGRAPENRGNGLKFVRDVVAANPISLQFYSGRAVLNLGPKKRAVQAEPSAPAVHGCLAVITFSGEES